MKVSKSKIVSCLMIVLSICMMGVSFALDTSYTPSNVSMGNLKPTVLKVLGAIQTIGVVVAIGMVMYAGIKYLTSGAGEKAKAKEQLVPIAIGAILVAAAPTVVSWLFSITSTTTGT